MNEKFYELSAEKQQRIINAGLEVFGAYDYPQASTDDIAAKAGISKGLLFYYFKNKKEFYLFLFDYCCNFFHQQICTENFHQITDFFDLMEYAARIKYSLILQYPHFMNFVMKAYYSRREEVSEAMKERIGSTIGEIYTVYFKNIDFSRFKEEVDPQKLLNMLTWMAEGYIQDKLRQSETLNIDELMQDFHDWQKMFRKIAYKEVSDETHSQS